MNEERSHNLVLRYLIDGWVMITKDKIVTTTNI